jgi:hypothetical protein
MNEKTEERAPRSVGFGRAFSIFTVWRSIVGRHICADNSLSFAECTPISYRATTVERRTKSSVCKESRGRPQTSFGCWGAEVGTNLGFVGRVSSKTLAWHFSVHFSPWKWIQMIRSLVRRFFSVFSAPFSFSYGIN